MRIGLGNVKRDLTQVGDRLRRKTERLHAGFACPIALAGGRLMGGSLDVLARGFAGSRLRMDQIGRLFGEGDFGPVTLAVTTGLEGALFAGCVVAALMSAGRRV